MVGGPIFNRQKRYYFGSASTGETSAAHLMAEFGLSRNGVLCHLRSLTAAGLLHERHDTHPRGSGPITYWSADKENASIMLDTLLDYMTGLDP